MRKRMFLFLIILLVAGTMVMAGGKTEAPKKTSGFVIGLSDFSLGNSWRVQMVAEAKYAASQKKALVKELIVTEADNSVEKQIADIEDLISKKVDAILITAANPKALVTVVDKAMKAGIVVVDFDNLVDTANITAHVDVDQKEFGKVQGEWLVKAMKEKGNIIAFNGMKGTAISALRFEGAKSVFDKYPNIKIVDTINAEGDEQAAYAALENSFIAHPDISGHISLGGTDYLWGRLMENKKAGNAAAAKPIFSSGHDLYEEKLIQIKNGWTTTAYGQNPYKQGYEAVKQLYELLTKGTPPKIGRAHV
jgi:ribose transport system substrate-binding protein